MDTTLPQHSTSKPGHIVQQLKYLIAYVTPAATAAGLWFGGWLSYGGVLVAFVAIPLVEAFAKGSKANLAIGKNRISRSFLDLLLYSNVAVTWGLLLLYLHNMAQGGWAWWEILGMTLSTAIILGGNGINVGHELGHRDTWYERAMGKALLLPSFYMHFIIEHNFGHHKWVATPNDPASAPKGESVYHFMFRSARGGYLSAWRLAAGISRRKGHPPFHPVQNPMIGYTVLQLAYLAAVAAVWGWATLPYAILAGVLGFLLLECVNYIQHYGLRRKLLPSGRYEAVQPHHSWNSNHSLGRIFLYELTRHSDHHYRAHRKYHTLRHFDDAPQMPLGYSASILLSLVPPLWFAKMDPLVEEAKQRFGM